MDWNTTVSLAAAVASAAAAVAAVWLASRTFRRSAELQAFLALTERYESIVNELPSSARTAETWPEDVDADMAIRLRYLNLCSEEYYLKEKGLLSAAVWGIWEQEMRTILASPPYRTAWAALSSQFDSYPEFTAFVRDAHSELGEPAR